MKKETWYKIFEELEEFVVEEEEAEEEEEVTFAPLRIHRAELYLDQEELVKERVQKYNVTAEELEAVKKAAEAVHTYRRTKSVDKTAMDIMEELTDDVERQLKLLNIVIPLARTFTVSEKERKQHSYYDRRKG